MCPGVLHNNKTQSSLEVIILSWWWRRGINRWNFQDNSAVAVALNISVICHNYS